jgi:hypothetical protein
MTEFDGETTLLSGRYPNLDFALRHKFRAVEHASTRSAQWHGG